MKKRNLIIFLMIIVLCGCDKKENFPNRIKKDSQQKFTLKKENLYGCWNLKTKNTYEDEMLLYSGTRKGKISFYENKLIFCTYLDDEKKYDCKNFSYEIENDKYLKINGLTERDDLIVSKFFIDLYEGNNPILFLEYFSSDLDHQLYYTYGCDEKDS